MDNKPTIQQITSRFAEVSQEVWAELEQLDLTIEAVEIFVIPIERRIHVVIKEHKNNSLIAHQADKSLVMKDISFYESVKQQLPPGSRINYMNMRNLTPEVVEQVLVEKEKYDANITTIDSQGSSTSTT